MNSAAEMKLENGATIFRSENMLRLMKVAERVAQHDAAVLIVGETGSGKEVVARSIHEHSLRFGKAFVDVNCAALPEHLVESELFGYEKGAFSGADSPKPGLFELADQGTLLLDEIGELDPKVQAKLLRVLDGVSYYRLGGNRKISVNVRVIAATNCNLEEDVRSGKFRSDLYHRLTQFQLRIPPLRERIDDISALAEFFLQQHISGGRFTNEATEVLQHYHWPGNVRELKNVVFKLAMHLKSGQTEVRARDLPSALFGFSDVENVSAQLQGSLEDMEKRMILRALDRNRGNQAKAAEQLGVSDRTLRRKLASYKREQRGPSGSAMKQRFLRVTVETPVLLRVSGREISAVSVNVSSGGLALRSPVELSNDSLLDMSFVLPGTSSPIEAKGKLAWIAPNGLTGVSITEMHPVLQRELHQWISRHAKQESGNSPAI